MNEFNMPYLGSMIGWGQTDYSLGGGGMGGTGMRADPAMLGVLGQPGAVSPQPVAGAGMGFLPQFDPATGRQLNQGWGGMALGAANGIFNAYMGLKQYGLAKDQFGEARRQFGLNFDAQKRTTNAALADRQAARLASNPGAYQSVADYMSQYGIQGG